MRLWIALTVVGVTWLLAGNAAVNSSSLPEFLLMFAVNCLCAYSAAILLEPSER